MVAGSFVDAAGQVTFAGGVVELPDDVARLHGHLLQPLPATDSPAPSIDVAVIEHAVEDALHRAGIDVKHGS